MPAQPKELTIVDIDKQEKSNWQELTDSGAVRSFQLHVGEVNEGFIKAKLKASLPDGIRTCSRKQEQIQAGRNAVQRSSH